MRNIRTCGLLFLPLLFLGGTIYGAEFHLGVQLQSLLPNNLPGFRTSVPVYGPQFTLGLGPGALELQLSQGTADGTNVHLAEFSYRQDWDTPFVHFFAIGGAHYIAHGLEGGDTFNHFGAHFGPGILFHFGQGVKVPLSLRVHLERESLVSFGGGITFQL